MDVTTTTREFIVAELPTTAALCHVLFDPWESESAILGLKAYFLNSAVQFWTRLSGAGVSSVAAVFTRKCFPSGKTSYMSLSPNVNGNRIRFDVTCNDPLLSLKAAATRFPFASR